MEVTADEVKYINGYIAETAKVTGKTSSNITEAGTYTLDGVQAVAYGRIRYTEGGDYKRTERMRDVITAILKKLQTKNMSEINNILDKILPTVYSNITANSIISEIPSVSKYKVIESLGWPYEVKAYTNPIWYGAPVTLESNVQRMHQELFGETDYTVSNTVKTISDKIIKKTGYSK